MATMTTGIKYNAFDNTITMSTAYAKRAQKYGSPEYKELVKLMNQNPGATTSVAEKRAATKKLTIKEMEAYIGMMDNKDELMKQFKAVREIASKRFAMPYHEIVNWFEANFPVIRNENGTLNVEAMKAAAVKKNEETKAAATNEEAAKDNMVSFPVDKNAADNSEETAEAVGA